MKRMRNKTGAAITMGVVLALALVVLGVGFMLMSMYFGGQSETKNATDAGALNVGKQALDKITVPVGFSENHRIFRDVTNDGDLSNDDKVSLRRINRVWAQAMLIAINAKAAETEGYAGSGPSNADSAAQGAEEISDALTNKLTQASNLYGFFDDFSQRNSVRMITTNNTVNHVPGANWQTSLMERENESNITMTGSSANFNLPPEFNLDSDFVTDTTRNPAPADSSGKVFLKGYKPVTVAKNTFWFVPFLYDEKPHMVSRAKFEQNKKNVNALSWSKPVPNAFSAEGAVVDVNPKGQKATSWVLTNPRQPFKMCIPHSFLHIHVDDMKSKWYFFPSGYPPVKYTEQDYGYIPEDQSYTAVGGGLLSASVTADFVVVGTDVVGRPLDDIIFGTPTGNKTFFEQHMTNRINEMVSKVGVVKTKNDLHNCLSDPATIGWLVAGFRDYYVYTTDGENLKVNPQAIAQADMIAHGWQIDISKDADGTEHLASSDDSSPAPIFFIPTVVPDPFCNPSPANFGFGEWHKELGWKPGSGYNGNLGDVRVKRWTEIYTIGHSTPII